MDFSYFFTLLRDPWRFLCYQLGEYMFQVLFFLTKEFAQFKSLIKMIFIHQSQ